MYTGDICIGGIRKDKFAGTLREEYWAWSVGVHGPGTSAHGQAVDLETAKAEVIKNWREWLRLAGLTVRQV